MMDAAKMASIPLPKTNKSGSATVIPILFLVMRPEVVYQADLPPVFHQ
jgi:hypothetical protein